MKVQNRAYASQSNALFVSHGSRAHCFNERPRPHSNGLKAAVPPHSVASSRNKAVCAFRLVPRPRVWGCDGSLPSTKRIIAASRHFARRVASPESPKPRRLTWGFWRRAAAAWAHWVRRKATVAVVTGSLGAWATRSFFVNVCGNFLIESAAAMYKCVQIGASKM